MSRVRRPARWKPVPEPTTTITLVEGEGKGMSFTVDCSKAEVEEARRSCASSSPNEVALSIVLAFLRYMNAPCSPEELGDESIWPVADVVTLFAMLDMPLMEWTPAEDRELEQLLAEMGGGRG